MSDFIPELVVTGKQESVDVNSLPADEAQMLAKLTARDAELIAMKVPAHNRYKILMSDAVASCCNSSNELEQMIFAALSDISQKELLQPSANGLDALRQALTLDNNTSKELPQ